MPYQSLALPRGMSANGTMYQNAGMWYDGDRVRWHNGLLTPIGGWEVFNTTAGPLDQVLADPTTAKSRALKGWKLNDGSNVYVVGANTGLFAFNRATPTVYDITPDDFISQPAGPLVYDGYGMWFYGTGAYGTRRPYEEQSSTIFNWCLRNWGQNLLAAQRGKPSKLYEWDATLLNKAVAVANAPEDFDCFHVTPQRIVVTAGAATEPRLVQWSTSENNTEWAPTIQNQAGFQILSGAGRFVEIVGFRDQTLLISETDVHSMRYLGPPYVHGFDQIGQDCGCSTGAAVVATDDFVVWPGSGDFFVYDGSIRRLHCPVMDRFRRNISEVNYGKMVGFVNAEWSEVWWLYQAGDDDIDSYIVWDFKDDHWYTGTTTRTVGGVLPLLNGPVMMGADGYLYKHELQGVVPGESASEVYVESGPIEIKGGNATQYFDYIQPDFIDQGSVNVTIFGRDRPTAPEVAFGPYNITYPANTSQPVPCRARGHTIRVRIEGASSTWELGNLRINMLNTGGRK